MAGKTGGKTSQKRKSWYEIYWPDSTNSHANNTKVGKLHFRRVAGPAEGKRLFKNLNESQEIFEKTGVEAPILQGTGAYVADMRRRAKQHST